MKLRILIVEDEPPIARSLKVMMEQLPDMTVVACAVNGLDALNWLEKEAVDIVFTDVSMPIMGGIELISNIYNHYPDIVTVIVSGYQDFEYVRSALQYKAYDYILKPVFKPDLHQLLESLKSASLGKLKERQERQLLALLNRKDKVYDHAYDSLAHLQRFSVAVVCAGALPSAYQDSLLPAKEYWAAVNLAAMLPADQDSLQCWVLEGKSAAEKIIVSAFEKADDRLWLEQVYSQLPKSLYITMVVGPAIHAQEGLAESYEGLRLLLYRTISIEHCQFSIVDSYESDGGQVQGNMMLMDTVEMESFLLHLHRAKEEAAKQTMDKLFERCAHTKVSQAALESLLLQILHRIGKFSAGQDVQLTELELELGEAVVKAPSYGILLPHVMSIFEKASRLYKVRDLPQIVLDVEQYLHEHYKESVTNDDLSKRFGFVPSYITKLFRTHKGVSPSQYMTRIRLEKAKEIMRSEPQLMLKEVAEKVGYNDPLYFSRVFHKEVGVWPSEYK